MGERGLCVNEGRWRHDEAPRSNAAVSAGLKIRKVVTLVKVVQAWRQFSKHLSSLSSIVSKLSRSDIHSLART